jgi:hypothetical protein
VRARVTALVRLVPLDPRGQQALDETLADWRHEKVAASSRRARLACDLRAMGAIIHTLAAITARQMMDAVQHEAAWLSLFVLMYGYLLHGLLIEGAARLGQSPASVQFLNTHFRESAFAAAGGQGALARGLAERTLFDLLASGGAREIAIVSLRFSLVAACPAMVLLACPFQTASRRIRWLAATLVPVLGFGLVIVGSQGLSYGYWFSPLLPWIFPMTGILAALQLRQRQLAHHTLP